MRRLLFLVVLVLLGGCSSGPQGQEPLPSRHQRVAEFLQGYSLKRTPTTPTHLSLPAVRAWIVPLAMSGQTLIPPSDPRVLGWWGQPACADHGRTLLLGHTVHRAAWKIYGHGVLDNLEDIPVGTAVNVSGCHYVVTSNRVVSKTYVRIHAAQLFSQTGPPRVVVVTCEGYSPKTHAYSDNVVLVAKPTT